MEWPAQVMAGEPYAVRVVIPPLCTSSRLVVRQVTTRDTVAFDARWERIRPREWQCEPEGPIYTFTTVDAAPIAGPARSIALRATGLEAGSMRSFGRLEVVDGAAGDRMSGAGRARFWTQSAACQRIQPLGVSSELPQTLPSYQFAGTPRDTSQLALSWVEGYFTASATACQTSAGDTLIFHVTADNPLR